MMRKETKPACRARQGIMAKFRLPFIIIEKYLKWRAGKLQPALEF